MHIDPRLVGISIVQPVDANALEPFPVVLVVEDDKYVRQLLCRILGEKLRYTTIVCAYPQIALQFLQLHYLDVSCVITEMSFFRHYTDGSAFIHRLTLLFPSLPVIVLVSPLDEQIAKNVRGSNIEKITKPFQIDDLLDALQRAVKSPSTINT